MRRTSRGFGFVAFLVTGVLTMVGAMPDYLRQALNRFSPETPAGWSYTIETTRDAHQLLEHFDPTGPPGQQWTLLQLEHRAPSAEEREKYSGSRPNADAGGPKSNFRREDIEPGSLELLREDEDRAEFVGAFRSAAAGADKMLGHLRLRLWVRKREAFIERYRLELTEPYWPVLGVKMNRLDVTGEFAAPHAGEPGLPLRFISDFSGRILLIPVSEKVTVTYRDFAPVHPELSR